METFERDGLVFDVTDSGPDDGEVVVLLHGFPQDRTAWTGVADRLNAAGLRTLAPDQRGYSPGAAPTGRAAYDIKELIGDVVALIKASGQEKVHVVGHDWGGAVAWSIATHRPDLVSSVTVCSTPHPGAMAWAMQHGGQWRKSWYMAAFNLPLLPELYLMRTMESMYQRTRLPKEYADRYVQRFRTRESLRGPLGWYRSLSSRGSLLANARPKKSGSPGSRRVTVPATYLWGNKDFALGRAAALKTADYVEGPYRFIELDAGHWLPEVCTDEVSEAILERVHSLGS
ncbi:alpha/beta fold hydrolase [Yimella sp. cx-51]|uniref:alpha/beta fold hydrolase n=1 Tax=Yimella sp. cx-51 TaxID=2770551 RepID=UPI00165DA7C5|nr:alpha/beta fold hydrolase [Yimella sp. cx-51]MBC9956403.1 alpha/beta fold hydrolase [Yimella sp. cx-51]QTH38479.1 alpha/beta fold hydrolase [Yimella sp. cx-51]